MKQKKAKRDGDLQKAAEIEYGKIPELEKTLAKIAEKLEKENGNRLLRENVEADDIARVVAKWTGIPAEKLVETEKEKLAQMEKVLGKRVIGQKKAIEAVSNAVRRSRAGLSEDDRPWGKLSFSWPNRRWKNGTRESFGRIFV